MAPAVEAELPESVLSVIVSVLPLMKMPPPMPGEVPPRPSPWVIVRPLRVTFVFEPSTSKTRDALPPLIVNWLAPGPGSSDSDSC